MLSKISPVFICKLLEFEVGVDSRFLCVTDGEIFGEDHGAIVSKAN